MATPKPESIRGVLRMRVLQKSLSETFSIEDSPHRFLRDLGEIDLKHHVEGEWIENKPDQLKEK